MLVPFLIFIILFESMFKSKSEVLTLPPQYNLASLIVLALETLKHSEWSAKLQPSSNEKIILQIDKMLIPFLIKFLVQNDIDILSAETRHSLENYFLSLTNSQTYVEPASI